VKNVKIKLVVITLLVITMVTMMCSTVSAEENMAPQSRLLELRGRVLGAEDWLFKGLVVTNTRQLKDALVNKIDVAINMLDGMLIEPCRDKLRNDIAPKLAICDTTHVRAQSWLYIYPEGTPEYRMVQSFAADCQAIIESILMDQPK
jgi:hypothetical protein